MLNYFTLLLKLPCDMVILEVGIFGVKGSIKITCKYFFINMVLSLNIILTSIFFDYFHYNV